MAGIWDTATFVWNPGGASTASFNEVDSEDAAGLTDGTYISSPRAGRTYTGAVGSRFDTIPASTPLVNGFTSMAVVSAATGEIVHGVFVGEKASSNDYAKFLWDGDAAGEGSMDLRAAGGTLPGTNWCGGLMDNPRFADFGLHTVVLRGTKVDDPDTNTHLLEMFVDGKLVHQSRQVMSGAIAADRLTLGRFDRTSAANSTGGNVFAAAYWPLSVTDAEVQAISYDPYSYPSAPAGFFYKPGDLTDEWAGCKFFWTADHGEASGIDVVQGAVANHTPITPADSEKTKLTIDGRAFGNREEFTMDLGFSLGVNDLTVMVWTSQTTTAGAGPIWAMARDPDTNAYFWMRRDSNKYDFLARNTSNIGPVVDTDTTDLTTTLRCYVATTTYSGTTLSIETFLDTISDKTTGSGTITAANSIRFPQNITIGGIGDGSPGNATVIEVYAAAMWNRQLSDAEITLVLADPDSILSQLPAYTASVASAGLGLYTSGQILLTG